MKFGICAPVDSSKDIKETGWDFVEEHVQNLLQGSTPGPDWKGAEKAKGSALPVLAANCLVPATLKITGPEANLDKLTDYMSVVVQRAASVGMKTLVFGSGGARNVPDGFDREKARRQILDFARMAANFGKRFGVTIVAEPLNRGECNIINSVGEAMTYVKELDHPNFQCLLDTYHFWLEDEPLDNVRAAMPWLRHVHISDKTRVPPGESGANDDYKSVFRVLKEGKYPGLISVEAGGFDIPTMGKRVLAFVKKNWNEA